MESWKSRIKPSQRPRFQLGPIYPVVSTCLLRVKPNAYEYEHGRHERISPLRFTLSWRNPLYQQQ